MADALGENPVSHHYTHVIFDMDGLLLGIICVGLVTFCRATSVCLKGGTDT